MNANSPIIDTEGITKSYGTGGSAVQALRGIDVSIVPGEMVAIMGASGSGKSTLMNILGCLDPPTRGSYVLDGQRVDQLSRDELADVRNRKIGFVFQGFNLLARTSALENVELPLLYDRSGAKKNIRKLAVDALARVGLTERMTHEPNELSGGQQQRVAIARALVTNPAIILADEPTGNLDSRTSTEVLGVFQDLNRRGITIVLVTHEASFAQYASRVIELHDGLIARDEQVVDRVWTADQTAVASGALTEDQA